MGQVELGEAWAQYVGGKFVTIFPTQAAVAEASWPMK